MPPKADILRVVAKCPLMTATPNGHSLIYGFSDAIADLGVTNLDKPLTTEMVWRVIRDPKSCDLTRLMGDLN